VAFIGRAGARMIPLRFKIETTEAEPFVVRLLSNSGTSRLEFKGAASKFEAIFSKADEVGAEYRNSELSLRVLGADSSDIDGDVLLVMPKRGTAHRLIRAKSSHNTFLITERCDQLCVMCSQPPKEGHNDMFPYFEAAALLAPTGATLGISGGEPTLFKDQLFDFLRKVMTERPDLRFHILTNAQHFDQGDLNTLRSLDRSRIVWGVPLYARSFSVHDGIVGKPGAYDRLLKSLALLCQSGSQVELRTVLMAPNACELPALAKFVVSHLPFITTWAIMQLENIGYGRQNWAKLFFDSSNQFEPIAFALDIARSRGINTLLYNFPLCTIPDKYRALSPATISDWKRKFLEMCSDCKLKEDCGGFFEWHPIQHGYARAGEI
jgi:His-Xaa-Ser system radical SAM maturase HxsC